MNQKLADFTSQIRSKNKKETCHVIVLYFSGHGIFKGDQHFGISFDGKPFSLTNMIDDLSTPSTFVIGVFDCLRS